METCEVADGSCTPTDRRRRGMCDKHYRRWQRHGDPTVRQKQRDTGDAAMRWAKKYLVDASGCWLWTGGLSSQGYGIHSVAPGITRFAHRFGYEMAKGPVLDGLELDHLCRNRACVNPDHLEPVTHKVNVERGKSGAHKSRQTSCINGHEFTPENTYVTPSGTRSCRACGRAKTRDYMRRKRAEAKRMA